MTQSSMPSGNNSNYRPYFITSVCLHVGVILLLIFNVSFLKNESVTMVNKSKSTSMKPEVIKAVAINNKQVEQEIARLNQHDQEIKNQEIQRQKKLELELARVKKQKELEAQKLQQAKLQAKKIKQEQEQLKRKQEEITKKNKQAEADLAKKQQEKRIVEKELKEKLAKRKQEDLLAKLKAEQQEILDQSLEQEEELLEASRKQSSLIMREVERYILLQQAKVSRNWIARESYLGKKLVTKLEIRLDASGQVVTVVIVQPSGDNALDTSARNAILKASPLPVPKDENIRKNFTVYRFTFRPDELT